MKQLTRRAPVSPFRLGSARLGGVLLAGVMLLSLALMVSGLMLVDPVVSAAAPFKPPPRPTATATTRPTATPTRRPTATAASSPTRAATPTTAARPTAATTATARPGASTGGTAGAGTGGTQPAASFWRSSLLWGAAAMVAALAVFGLFLWLFTRRAARERQQQLAPASRAQGAARTRLNQLHQLLPARPASPPTSRGDEAEPAEVLVDEEDASQPQPPQELPWSSSPRPPRWLIEAGLLKGSTGKQPPKAQPEP